MQRRKEGARLYLESSMRDLRDTFCNGGAMHRAQIQRTQNEQVLRHLSLVKQFTNRKAGTLAWAGSIQNCYTSFLI